ncbi:cupin [Desulfuromonas soudanensis]|uniref:Cupin n=1 Tax=Desulfuromonas soudanensis TaxID=1603606 RepID=A0A0M4DCB5_9BACT|nr:cupin domain-containing protein [Desulfuromonas soudanensis]ALC18142.1 cupin [Desulfuromonas soudanensis]
MESMFWDYKEKVAFDKEKAGKVVLAETAHSRTTLWCLLPGQHIHPHVHAGDHIWVVLEGTGDFLSNAAPRPLEPGAVVVAPAGQPHGIDNSGSEGLVFVSVSAG